MKIQFKRIFYLCLKHTFSVLAGVVIVMTLQSCTNSSKVKLYSEPNNYYHLTEIPDTDGGRKLIAHISTITAHGEDAESKYQTSLNELRKDSTMHETIYSAYKKFSENKYIERILLTETLKELRTTDALNSLNEIATAKIPTEKSKDLEYSTRSNEVVIRITAVEGMTILSNAQNKKAKELLLNLTQHSDLTIKQMAIRGYLTSIKSTDELNRQIKIFRKQLPQDQHWIITTKSTDITTVPHPNMPNNFDLKKNNKNKNEIPKLKI